MLCLKVDFGEPVHVVFVVYAHMQSFSHDQLRSRSQEYSLVMASTFSAKNTDAPLKWFCCASVIRYRSRSSRFSICRKVLLCGISSEIEGGFSRSRFSDEIYALLLNEPESFRLKSRSEWKRETGDCDKSPRFRVGDSTPRMGDGEPPRCIKENDVLLRGLLGKSNEDSDILVVACRSLLRLRMKIEEIRGGKADAWLIWMPEFRVFKHVKHGDALGTELHRFYETCCNLVARKPRKKIS